MSINLEIDTSQVYKCLITNSAKSFHGNDLNLRLKSFDGNNILDIIMLKYVT